MLEKGVTRREMKNENEKNEKKKSYACTGVESACVPFVGDSNPL